MALFGACGGGGSGTDRSQANAGGTSSGSGNQSGGASGSGTSGGATSGGSGGSGGGASSCAPKCTCPYPAGDGANVMIDDLEDGNGQLGAIDNRIGYWDFSRDASSGTTTPAANTNAIVPEDGGANGTAKALHVSGQGLTGWGAGLAPLLNNGCSYDASEYGGIAFYAKGTASGVTGPNKILVMVGMPEFIPAENGGTCTDTTRCFSRHRATIDLTGEWKQYKVAWADLKPGWITDVMFDASRIRDLNFSVDAGSTGADGGAGVDFDIWIDELEFLPKGATGNLGGSGGSGGNGSGGTGGSSGGAGGEGGA